VVGLGDRLHVRSGDLRPPAHVVGVAWPWVNTMTRTGLALTLPKRALISSASKYMPVLIITSASGVVTR